MKNFYKINFEINKLFLICDQKVLILKDSMDGIDFFSLNDFEIEGHM
jgi:hypothetical protein